MVVLLAVRLEGMWLELELLFVLFVLCVLFVLWLFSFDGSKGICVRSGSDLVLLLEFELEDEDEDPVLLFSLELLWLGSDLFLNLSRVMLVVFSEFSSSMYKFTKFLIGLVLFRLLFLACLFRLLLTLSSLSPNL